VVGLGAATVGVVGAAYTESLVTLAVLVPVPTLAAAVASFGGAGRLHARGLLGLALADGAILVGLAVLLDRGGTTAIGPVAGIDLGAALVLGGAAAKAGVVPWVATWRLAASEGPGAPLAIPLRAQGVVLALLGALVAGAASASFPLAASAAVATLLCGGVALVARSPVDARAAATAAATAALFLPLGLGGAVGARAALFLSPALLLAPAALEAAGAVAPVPRARRGARLPRAPHPAWRWIGGAGVALGLVSLIGVPPGGAFPGTWLSLTLATARSASDLWFLALGGGVAVGLALALLGAVPTVRTAAPRPEGALAGLAAGAFLLYLGVQPVRLGIGWLLRVEGELGIPPLLPSAGGPVLPPIAGWDLLWTAAPALGIVLAAVVLAGGVRDRRPSFEAMLALRRPGWLRLPGPVRPITRPVGAAVARARRLGVGYALAFLLEAGAVAVAAWVVLAGLRLGLL